MTLISKLLFAGAAATGLALGPTAIVYLMVKDNPPSENEKIGYACYDYNKTGRDAKYNNEPKEITYQKQEDILCKVGLNYQIVPFSLSLPTDNETMSYSDNNAQIELTRDNLSVWDNNGNSIIITNKPLEAKAYTGFGINVYEFKAPEKSCFIQPHVAPGADLTGLVKTLMDFDDRHPQFQLELNDLRELPHKVGCHYDYGSYGY